MRTVRDGGGVTMQLDFDQWYNLTLMLNSYQADLEEHYGQDAQEHIDYITYWVDDVLTSQEYDEEIRLAAGEEIEFEPDF